MEIEIKKKRDPATEGFNQDYSECRKVARLKRSAPENYLPGRLSHFGRRSRLGEPILFCFDLSLFFGCCFTIRAPQPENFAVRNVGNLRQRQEVIAGETAGTFVLIAILIRALECRGKKVPLAPFISPYGTGNGVDADFRDWLFWIGHCVNPFVSESRNSATQNLKKELITLKLRLDCLPFSASPFLRTFSPFHVPNAVNRASL